jgi:ATP-dependent exoDNAse (exonuclease V) alpha subunit
MILDKIELNEEFKRALDLMERTKKHIFITGKAGTGKSTLLEYFRNITKKKIVVLAPTGVAALNVSGQTIHSFFKFKPDITYEKVKKLKDKIYKEIDTIVIDEISMVRADLLDCVDRALQLANENSEPFGGKQMIFFGDLYQLPPVAKSNEKIIFKDKYETVYFFSAEVMNRINLEVIELQKVYRQKDEKFIELLNSVRFNTIDDEKLELLNERYNPDFKLGKKDFYIYLTPRNDYAQNINQEFLNKLSGRVYSFEAEIYGEFDENDFPNDEILYLKKGAQVMFLNNDSKGRWVNGTVGIVKDIDVDNEVIYVNLINERKTVEVERLKWQVFNYIYNQEKKVIETEVVGYFIQFPIKLAWAITIHKSQGKTFDNVIIDLKGGIFAPGQLYVALSRCRTLEGIILKQKIKKSHIFNDWKIVKFLTNYAYKKSEEKLPLEKKIEIIKEAIKNKKEIEVTYLKSNNESSKRVLRPIKIDEMEFMGREFLALLAYCYKRKEERVFRIDRILDIKIIS